MLLTLFSSMDLFAISPNKGLKPRTPSKAIWVITNTAEPDVTLQSSDYQQVENIFILSKWNWEVPSSDENKAEPLGDTAEGTTVYEGLESDIPDNALNCARFETGIKVRFSDSSCFFVVSSINPFDLAVNHDVSFSQVEDCEYSFETLC